MDAHTGLNTFDYAVLATVLLSGMFALLRGFVKELFSLLAWVGAYYSSVRLNGLVLPWVHTYIKSDHAATIAATVGVFCFALIILMVVGSLASQLVRGQTLTAIDRSLGFIFGIARGLLLVSLIYFSAESILWPDLDPDVQAEMKSTNDKSVSAEDTQIAKEAGVGGDPTEAPKWILSAKTRPALQYGVYMLKTVIPKDMIDKKIKEYSSQKSALRHALDQKALDELSTPVPATSGQDKTPTYDQDSRAKLDSIINQRSQ